MIRVEDLTRHPSAEFVAETAARFQGGREGVVHESEKTRNTLVTQSAGDELAALWGCGTVRRPNGGRVFRCPICLWPEEDLPKRCSKERHDVFYDEIEQLDQAELEALLERIEMELKR